MNAQAISAATILVRFADPAPAGKKQATIKASDGTVYGVWPKDFGRFQPGGRYNIEFTERPYQGRVYRTIVKAEPVSSGAPSPSQRSVSEGEGVTGTSHEFEFVTRLLAAYVQCCGVENTAAGLAAKARELRGVYRQVWGIDSPGG
jgi:hypothetical protein